ncbi:MAG: hypothetical protein JJ974_09840 [Phycisphaerales bacterium]|nr:hypothetical protein [Phycisphaerales bacterium]
MKSFAAFTIIAALTPLTSAEVLLHIDLSVHKKLTITATEGLSANTITGRNLIGIYLEGLNGNNTNIGVENSTDFSNLTSASNPADTYPLIEAHAIDSGLNIWALSTDNELDFTESQRAFTGTATWDLTTSAWESLLAGTKTGNIYFPARYSQDLDQAAFLGTYQVIPSPSSFVPFTLLALAITRRKRIQAT